ncbi:MAG: fibronectin type III domain-containing protein [Candidatus Daviesbacteria bacterium]
MEEPVLSKKRFPLFWLPLLGITFLILIPAAAGLFILNEPSSKPLNVFISNISDHQVSISWTTEKPTRGKILVSKGDNFPLLPIFTKSYKDDGEKDISKTGFYTSHHVTIGNLDPQITYQFRIYQGFQKAYQGSLITAKTLNSLAGPQPIYGRVLAADKQTPAVGAIIYFQAGNEATKSSILSTLTNYEGRWSLDLSNLKDNSLTNIFPIDKETKELVIVEGGSSGRVKVERGSGKDSPWPDIFFN